MENDSNVWIHGTHAYCDGPPSVDVDAGDAVELVGWFFNKHQEALMPFTHLLVDGANRIWVSEGPQDGVTTWYEITGLRHE